MISIVLTTFNGENYLREQLDSILCQTYDNFELIIIDDCSSDITCSIIKEYQNKDKRITFINNNENLGCSRNFEKGISYTSGSLIAFCDQDDVWTKTKLSTLKKRIESENLDMVYSDCEVIDNNNVVVLDSFSRINKNYGLTSSEEKIATISILNSYVLGCSMLIKRDALIKCMPFEHGKFNHDKWIVFNLACFGSFSFVKEKLFKYRIHSNNLSIGTTKASDKPGLIRPYYSVSALKRIDKYVLNESKEFKSLLHDIGKLENNSNLLNKIVFALKYFNFFYMTNSKLRRIKKVIKYVIG